MVGLLLGYEWGSYALRAAQQTVGLGSPVDRGDDGVVFLQSGFLDPLSTALRIDVDLIVVWGNGELGFVGIPSMSANTQSKTVNEGVVGRHRCLQ